MIDIHNRNIKTGRFYEDASKLSLNRGQNQLMVRSNVNNGNIVY